MGSQEGKASFKNTRRRQVGYGRFARQDDFDQLARQGVWEGGYKSGRPREDGESVRTMTVRGPLTGLLLFAPGIPTGQIWYDDDKSLLPVNMQPKHGLYSGPNGDVLFYGGLYFAINPPAGYLGVVHRLDGPAIIFNDGIEMYIDNGLLMDPLKILMIQTIALEKHERSWWGRLVKMFQHLRSFVRP